jgi:hypothetical protein
LEPEDDAVELDVEEIAMQLVNEFLEMVKLLLLTVVFPRTELEQLESPLLYEYAPIATETPPPEELEPEEEDKDRDDAVQLVSALSEMVKLQLVTTVLPETSLRPPLYE